MADAVGLNDTVQALNNDLYLMSAYGRQYGLDKEKKPDDEEVNKPGGGEVAHVSNGLVYYDEESDPGGDGRRSRTAILLDSVAEICLSQPGEVYAVACVVPLSRPTAAASVTSADRPPTLIVAANHGVPPMTQQYLHAVLLKLKGISEETRPGFRPKVDKSSRTPDLPKKSSVKSEPNIPSSSCLPCSTRFRLLFCGQNYS
jgi:hypothetical protein